MTASRYAAADLRAWSDLLDELEASIADAECGGGGRQLDLAGALSRLGPLPVELAARAEALSDRAAHLVGRLEVELQRVSEEMDRVTPRRRVVVPPAPSHLDQLA